MHVTPAVESMDTSEKVMRARGIRGGITGEEQGRTHLLVLYSELSLMSPSLSLGRTGGGDHLEGKKHWQSGHSLIFEPYDGNTPRHAGMVN